MSDGAGFPEKGATIVRQADMGGTLTFELVDAHPCGAARMPRPVIAWMGNHQEQTVWAAMKHHRDAAREAAAVAPAQPESPARVPDAYQRERHG